MVFDGIIISFIVGLFRKGNLKGLATLKLKWGWVFPILLLIQIGVTSLQDEVEFIGEIGGYLYILIYIIGFIFLYINRNLPGLVLILIGVFLNFLVISVNGGRMPVSAEAAAAIDPMYVEVFKAAITESEYAKHILLTESSNLKFLADIIPLSKPYPITQIISIGDVVMNIGIFNFIQHLMLSGKRDKENGTGATTLKEVS